MKIDKPTIDDFSFSVHDHTSTAQGGILPGGAGTSGYSGYSGAGGAGASGYSGYSGKSGYSGYSGIGSTGTSGYSGYSGAGISGYSGYSGVGNTGTSGYSGYSGPSGAGVSGYSGYSGTDGAATGSGYSGYSGSIGISGYSGYSGKSGYSGYSGPIWTPTPHTTAYSGTLTLDASAYDIYDITLTGPLTLDFNNGVDGKSTRVRLHQDSTGGRVLTAGSSIRFGTDIPSIVLSTGINKMDYIQVCYDSTAGKFDLVSYVRGF